MPIKQARENSASSVPHASSAYTKKSIVPKEILLHQLKHQDKAAAIGPIKLPERQNQWFKLQKRCYLSLFCNLNEFLAVTGSNYLPQVHKFHAISNLNLPSRIVFWNLALPKSGNWKQSVAESSKRLWKLPRRGGCKANNIIVVLLKSAV